MIDERILCLRIPFHPSFRMCLVLERVWNASDRVDHREGQHNGSRGKRLGDESGEELLHGVHHVSLVVEVVVTLHEAVGAGLDEQLAGQLLLLSRLVQQTRVIAVDDLVVVCVQEEDGRSDGRLRVAVAHQMHPVLPAVQHQVACAAQ